MRDDNSNRAFLHPRERVLGQLAQLRHRAKIIAMLSGLAWTTTAAVLCLGALTLILVWWGPENIRIAGWIVVGAALLVVTVLSIVWPLVGLARPFAVERRVGKSLPALASDVLSAGQFALLPPVHPFSEDLLTAHFERVSGFMVSVRPAHVFPATKLILPGLCLCLASIAAVLLGSFAPALMRGGAMALWGVDEPPVELVAPTATSRPVISDLRLSLRYPDYLRRKPRQLEGLSGGLVAPLGTNVVLEGTPLLNEATHGFVLLPDGSRSQLVRGDDGLMRGQFLVGMAGEFRLALFDGRQAVEGPPYSLSLEPDAPPTIRLLRPKGSVELNEKDELTLDIEAQDDQGLGESISCSGLELGWR